MSEMGKIIMSPPPPPYAPCTRDEVATTMDADAAGLPSRVSRLAAPSNSQVAHHNAGSC